MTDLDISFDPTRLDQAMILQFLREQAHWAADMDGARLQRAIRHSLVIGAYHRGRQIGFARVITDYASFAYLSDVFVLPAGGSGHDQGRHRPPRSATITPLSAGIARCARFLPPAGLWPAAARRALYGAAPAGGTSCLATLAFQLAPVPGGASTRQRLIKARDQAVRRGAASPATTAAHSTPGIHRHGRRGQRMAPDTGPAAWHTS